MKDLIVALIAVIIFVLFIFVIVPLVDQRYFQGRSVFNTHIFIVRNRTKFIPGLMSDERYKVLENALRKKNYSKCQRINSTSEGSHSTEDIEDIEKGSQSDSSEEGNQETVEGNSSQSYTAEISGNSIINEDDEANMEEDVCAICLEQFKGGDSVTGGTQCIHLYHKNCIIRWMEKRDHCPFCREDMLTVQEFQRCATSILGEKRVEEVLKANTSNLQTRNGQF